MDNKLYTALDSLDEAKGKEIEVIKIEGRGLMIYFTDKTMLDLDVYEYEEWDDTPGTVWELFGANGRRELSRG